MKPSHEEDDFLGIGCVDPTAELAGGSICASHDFIKQPHDLSERFIISFSTGEREIDYTPAVKGDHDVSTNCRRRGHHAGCAQEGRVADYQSEHRHHPRRPVRDRRPVRPRHDGLQLARDIAGGCKPD